ncbi:hypothetical protein D3C78_1344940 [compost metagenome]|jgi:hypothetical protein
MVTVFNFSLLLAAQSHRRNCANNHLYKLGFRQRDPVLKDELRRQFHLPPVVQNNNTWEYDKDVVHI